MNLLLVLLGFAFADDFTGTLREVDSGIDHDEDHYVLEVEDDPFFYSLTGTDGDLPQGIKTDIQSLGLVGNPVRISGLGNDEDMYIIVESIELDTTAAKKEVRVGGNFGTATALVVRVSGGGHSPARSRADVGDKVFGYGGDRLNLNIFEKCSYGKFKVVPFEGTVNGQTISKGVVDVDIGYDPRGHQDNKVVRDALNKIKDIYGQDNIDDVDHTMLYLPRGTISGGRDNWLAYAHAPGWMGVYNGDWMVATTTIAHELGHNLNLHHANENGQEYGDQSGIMGFGEMNLDGPDSCFNGPNNWQLGWYDDRRALYRSGDGSKVYKVVGVSDYDKTADSDVVVIKVGKHTYVSFNRATGINKGVREFPDKVLIHTWQGVSKMSWMVKALSSTGQSFTCDDGNNMQITLTKLDKNASPAYALVTITSSGAQNTAKWIPVAGEPLVGCKVDGLCVEGTYAKNEKCYIEAASDGQIMFDGNFVLPGNWWDADKLYIGSTEVKSKGDLPSHIRNGDILAWTTDSNGDGDSWKICMSPTGGDQPDPCAGVDCGSPGPCEANRFCFGGTCQATNKQEGASCDDGNANTVEDKCNAGGVCAGVDKCAGVNCAAENVCQLDGTCNINTGECDRQFASTSVQCDDGADYTINDRCDGQGQCKGEIDESQSLWTKNQGNCKVEGKCISSNNVQGTYGNNENCVLTARMRGALAFEGSFDIERGYDVLKVDGKDVRQASELPNVIDDGKSVTFTSDGSVTKGPWKICMSEPPAPPAPGTLNDFQQTFNALGKAAGSKVDCALSKVAQDYAKFMADNNHWGSNPPNGYPSLSQQVSNAGSSLRYTMISAGTNAGNAGKMFTGWQGVVTHPQLKSFGVGSASGGRYGHYAVLLLNSEDSVDSASCGAAAEVQLGDLMTLNDEIPQTYSEMLAPSMFSSVQNILAAIGVLGLGYGAFQVCFKKGAYNPVTFQEEI